MNKELEARSLMEPLWSEVGKVNQKQVTRSELEARKGTGGGARGPVSTSMAPCPPCRRSACMDSVVPRQSRCPGGLEHLCVSTAAAAANSARQENILVGSAHMRLSWKNSNDWFCLGGCCNCPILIMLSSWELMTTWSFLCCYGNPSRCWKWDPLRMEETKLAVSERKMVPDLGEEISI